MRVEVNISGHQYFRSVAGEVLLWTHTVERFGEAYLQVPCVVVKTGVAVIQIPLKQQHYQIDLKIIGANP